MSRREALAKAPHMRGVELVDQDGQPVLYPFFYSCPSFDLETRRCTDYDNRPPVCRGYPWYDRGPSLATSLPPECSYREDIGQPVEMGTTRG